MGLLLKKLAVGGEGDGDGGSCFVCTAADVFMTCAKCRQPHKTRVGALANNSQCVLKFYVFGMEI